MVSTTNTLPQRKQKGAGTLAFIRDVTGDVDLSIAKLATQTEVAGALSSGGFVHLGCAFGVDPPGFEREVAEDEQCLEDGDVNVWSADEDYVEGQVVQGGGGIPGLAGKQCWQALSSGTGSELGEPEEGANWTAVDCGCAPANPQPGGLQIDKSNIELAYSPCSDVDECLSNECAGKRQIVVIFPRVIKDGKCWFPIKTWCGWVSKWKGQTIVREDLMKGDLEICRQSRVCSGCFDGGDVVEPDAGRQAEPPEAGEFVQGQ